MSNIILFGLFIPRLSIILLDIFSDWFTGVFDNWYWLLIGFVFMPTTALWYSVVVNWFGGEWNIWQTLVLSIAVITDVSSFANSIQKRKY